jgi:hypothetical protein
MKPASVKDGIVCPIYTAMTDGVVVIDGETVAVKAGDDLPYPYAVVMDAEPPRHPYRRHPRG